jgi:hypothetical protein|tara:strand:+ start:263 stop:451 length:189 start_codon:yes stop_codon:yes gene_type:complete
MYHGDKKKMMMGGMNGKKKKMMGHGGEAREKKMMGGVATGGSGSQPSYGGDINSAMPRATAN